MNMERAEAPPPSDMSCGDVIPSGDSGTGAVDVGQRDYSERALCQAAETAGGLNLQGEINFGGQMDITHNTYQDNRVINKNVHHHHGDVHQHAHHKVIHKGDVIHHHGDLHQTQNVHYSSNEAGYIQINDQSKIAMCSDQDVFVETPSFRAALQQTTQSGILLLIGPPGTGKSCTGHALLRHYESNGYTPLILHRFEEWRLHVGGDRQQVVLLEHIFGKEQFNISCFQDWQETFPTMKHLADSGKCVVIITVNDFILDAIHAEQNQYHFPGQSLNLADYDVFLSDERKRLLLKKHAARAGREISENVLNQIVAAGNSGAHFAACCRRFADSTLNEEERLKLFTDCEGGDVGPCGTGPKVYIRVSPDILKKSLMQPTKKTGHWGYAFTGERSDVRKDFCEEDWTTEGIQMNTENNSKDNNATVRGGSQQLSNTMGSESVDSTSLLDVACQNGDLDTVLTVLKTGVNLSSVNKAGFTALHTASLLGNVDIVKTLLDHHCPLNVTDRKKWTPLHVVCVRGCIGVAELLVQHGAKLETETVDGLTPLHIACRYGNAGIVRFLLENGAEVDARQNASYMICPLHVAAFYGHADVAELLIKFKAQIDCRDRGGWLPLHYACQEGHAKVLNLLIANSTASTQTNQTQNLQLSVDCHNGHISFLQNLLRCGVSSSDAEGKTSVCRSCYLTNRLALENLALHRRSPDPPTNGNITGLFLAAQNGHGEVTKILLKAGACAEIKTAGGWTPLILASHQGHADVVDLLLQYKTSMDDFLDNALLTALHLACRRGHKDVVDILLQHGASPDVCDNHGHNSLHAACIHGQANVLPSLLARGQCIPKDAEAGEHLMSLACKYGTADVVKCLINWIPNIVKFAQKSSVLHKACTKENVDIVNVLLQHSFCVDALDADGRTPLHVACEEGQQAVAEVLLKYGASTALATAAGNTPLHIVCGMHQVKTVQTLLENGSTDIEILDKDGRTALHVASREGSDDIVALLIASKANVNAQDSDQKTPLFYAGRHEKVAEILLANNADANIRSSDGKTVLHEASFYGKEGIVGKLLQTNIDKEARDSEGQTALCRACQARSNRINTAKVLLESGSDVNTIDKNGTTPVHFACSFGDVGLLEMLLQFGGKMDDQDKKVDTPLHKACCKGDAKVAVTLLEAGVALNELNHDGNTPLHLACSNLHCDVARHLLEYGALTTVRNKAGLSPINVVQSIKLEKSQSSFQPIPFVPPRFVNSANFSSSMQAQMQRKLEFHMQSITNMRRREEEKKNEEIRRKMDNRNELLSIFTEYNQQSIQSVLIRKDQHHRQDTQQKDFAILEQRVHGQAVKSEASAAEKDVTVKRTTMATDLTGKDETEVIATDGTAEKEDVKMQEECKSDNDRTREGSCSDLVDTKKAAVEGKRSGEKIETRESRASNDPPHNKAHISQQTTEEETEKSSHRTESRKADDSSKLKKEIKLEDSASPLHAACFHGNTAEVLHHLGPFNDINLPSKAGRTALHYACAGGHSDIAAVLLKLQADCAVRDIAGQSPLHLTSVSGHLDTLDLLLTCGVDANVVDKEGRTCLHLASFQGHEMVAAVLLSRGARVDATDHHGNTPLILATLGGHTDVCVLLLNAGADPNLQNKMEQSARSLATDGNLPMLARVIVRHISGRKHKVKQQ